MLYDNLEFHNVAELASVGHTGGLRIQRYPEKVRTAESLNNRARFISNQATGVEIRFCAESYRVHLYLRADSSEFPILIFRGDYFVKAIRPQAGAVQLIALDKTETPRIDEMGATLPYRRFSADIWRVFLGRSEFYYHGIDAMGMGIRPPELREKPSKTLLAYGSSITMGAGSSNFYHGYAVQTARLLDADCCNLGVGGACHAEGTVADWIADRDDWDFALFELGINMRGEYTAEEFEKRCRYFITTVRETQPKKHIFMVTLYPNYASQSDPLPEETSPHQGLTEREAAYNRILETIAREDSSGFLHLFKGAEILSDFSLLNADALHPSDTGHYQMAYNLADKIRTILA